MFFGCIITVVTKHRFVAYLAPAIILTIVSFILNEALGTISVDLFNEIKSASVKMVYFEISSAK